LFTGLLKNVMKNILPDSGKGILPPPEMIFGFLRVKSVYSELTLWSALLSRFNFLSPI